jgi:ribosomal protein L11 methyltransferase
LKWVEIQVKTSKEAVDAVSNILYDFGADGVVIEDNSIDFDDSDWDYLDEKMVNEMQSAKYATVKCYFKQGPSLMDKINLIKERVDRLSDYNLDKGPGVIDTVEVDDSTWYNWKKYYKPIKIGPNIVVKPEWEDYQAKEGEKIVELNPGMAFGTGIHETTHMCIVKLQKYLRPGADVIDVGCGSGILAITSAKLGAGHVLALDKDVMAVKVAKVNIELNNAADIVELRENNLLEGIKASADIIVANIVADAIISLFKDVEDNLRPGGIFITGGIIKERLDDVMDNAAKSKLTFKEKEKMGEWVTLVFSK